MKKYYYILLTISTLFFAGCGDDFLDKPPYGILTNDNYYQTEEDAFTALTAVYSQFAGEGGELQFNAFEFGDMASDDAWKGGETDGDRPFVNDVAFYRAMSNNQIIQNYWTENYRGVSRANILLDRLPDITFTNEDKRKLYTAEARVLRAFFYTILVRVYGAIPLVTEFVDFTKDEVIIPRSESEMVHQFLRTELNEAAQDLPIGNPTVYTWGRVTQGAAYALLARVELFFQSYPEAAAAAKKVIDSGAYKLEENYGKLFTDNNYVSTESVLEMIHKNTGGNGDDSILATYYRSRYVGGWGFLCPTVDLVKEFEVGDPRLIYTITETGDKFYKRNGDVELQNHEGYTSGDGYHSRKMFIPEPRRGDRSAMDTGIKIIRYADVLLMYAEALIEGGGDLAAATDAINQVRTRANNTPAYDLEAYGEDIDTKKASRMLTAGTNQANWSKSLPPIDSGIGQDALRKAVRHERRVELATESHRLYDLIRWGPAYMKERIEAARHSLYPNFSLSGIPEARLKAFPIPQREIDRTNGVYKQNEGW